MVGVEGNSAVLCYNICMVGLKIDRAELEKICLRYGVEFLGVFGSVARGEDSPDSDVDMLVRFGKKGVKGLMGMVAMERQLGEVFGKKVDLVTRDFLSPYFRENILAEVKPVYGKA